MGSYRDELSFEEMAVERDRALERERAAAEGGEPPPFQYGPPTPIPMLAARETAAAYGCEPTVADRTMAERLLMKVRHVLYTMDEQQSEIARLRENTRQVLARLSTA